jgi:hypothetical protein
MLAEQNMGDASYTRREKANFSGAAAADSLRVLFPSGNM